MNSIENPFSIKTNNRLFGNLDLGKFSGLDEIQHGGYNNANNDGYNKNDEIDIKIDKTLQAEKR